MTNSRKKLIVLGGGAAGFFCAVNAARMNPDLEVVLLEKTGKLLQKVKVSGGGRCNVTHHKFEISGFSKCYPRGEKFLKKALHEFGPADTIDWFQQRGVILKAEADGRMFPITDDSKTIVDCLMREADRYRVRVLLHRQVEELKPIPKGWELKLAGGETWFTSFVCVAVGGYQRKEQYHWLTKNTGLEIVDPVPSLFTFNTPGNPITGLTGIAQNALVKIEGSKLESIGPVLITHWGLSGPAILRLSAFAARYFAERKYEFRVIINWLPMYNENTLREKILQYRQERGSKKVVNTEWFNLPERLLLFLMQYCDIEETQRWADLPASNQNRLVKAICAFPVKASGKTTFKDEFVTAGGVSLTEIDPQTMQARRFPGLFFAGEIMDVDGITGGFNFQHAWTSGMIAARHIC